MERYLEKIKIVDDHFCFKKGFEIELIGGINLFVGDQGCGKSTILKGLNDQPSWMDISISDYTKKNGVDSKYFDTEHDNPRTKQANLNDGGSFRMTVASHFVSHGEAMKKITVDVIKIKRNTVLLLDEPEAALSLRNQYRLLESMREAEGNGCQLFVATHCLPLIESTEMVYSLEHRTWMTSGQFIELNKI